MRVQPHIEGYEGIVVIRDCTCIHSHFIIGERSVFTVVEAKDSRSIKWFIQVPDAIGYNRVQY